jgi:hypothetical protein
MRFNLKPALYFVDVVKSTHPPTHPHTHTHITRSPHPTFVVHSMSQSWRCVRWPLAAVLNRIACRAVIQKIFGLAGLSNSLTMIHDP